MGSDDAIAELEARVKTMRALGVTRWGDIELGPEPQSASDAKAPTQHTPDEIERKRRDDQRLLALGASGRLVPRLARPDQ